LERGFYGQIAVSKTGESSNQKIIVHDRQSGKLVEEKIPDYIRIAMRVMYTTGGGKYVEKGEIQNVLKHLTNQQGKKYNNPTSKKDIDSFITYHSLIKEEILDPLDSFKTFNEFFYRKLKPSARPIADRNNPKVVVSPADCRFHSFPTITSATEIWVKGTNFTLQHLVHNTELAKEFEGGSLVICRLAPQDYHRFHSPVDGRIVSITPLSGAFYTVNPIAIRQHVDVYTENKRAVVVIRTEEFGDVIYVTVGATMVGSIVFTAAPGHELKKGEEIGYFAFGGSTVLVIFKENAIKFDDDLLVNSQKPIETLLKIGEHIGVSAK